MSAGIYIFCGQVFEKNCPKYESTDELLSNCKKDQVDINCYDDEGSDEENINRPPMMNMVAGVHEANGCFQV